MFTFFSFCDFPFGSFKDKKAKHKKPQEQFLRRKKGNRKTEK